MLTIWNRKEIFVGNKPNRFDEIRYILSGNGIEYSYRLVNKNSTPLFGGGRRGCVNFGDNTSLSTTYYIYVNKKDYDKAFELLRRR